MADPRFAKINELFIQYSKGNFDYKIPLSGRLDEIDAFISNINMLGEELKATTISRNYFNNIFNSVSDMLFVLCKDGNIENINIAVTEKLDLTLEKLSGNSINTLFTKKHKNFFREMAAELAAKPVAELETSISFESGEKIICLCSMSHLSTEKGDKTGYLLNVRDITRQKEIDNLVIRTIIDTQEKERRRIARDVHDSLGQKLSSLLSYVKTIRVMNKALNIKSKELLLKSDEGIENLRTTVKEICFDLMPNILENFGLSEALHDLCRKVETGGVLKFETSIAPQMPALSKQLKIAVYRIVQEFINNSLKHGEATRIHLRLKPRKNLLYLLLKDNGAGFDYDKINKNGGMGLKNVRSRVISYGGEVLIKSQPGKGTSYEIIFPVKTAI